MKKIWSVLLACLCLVSAGYAQEIQETPILFKERMPAAIAEVFSSPAWEGWHCKSGAMGASSQKTLWEWPSAMVVMEKDGEAVLCGLTCTEDGKYYVDALGEKALFSDAEYEVTMAANRHFFVRQETPDGKRLDMEWALILNPEDSGKRAEGYWLLLSVVSWNGENIYTHFRTSQRSYQIDEYIREMQTALGTEAMVWGLRPYGLETFVVEDFPLTIQEAETWENRLPENIGMVECFGMELNLRKGPGTSTESLGKYYNAALLEILEGGAEWSRVRIGNVEGYMFNTYLDLGPEKSMFLSMNEQPLPLGRVEEATVLLDRPDGKAEQLQPLPEGSMFHVLGYRGDWLHICISERTQNKGMYFCTEGTGTPPGWMMDINGTYGYVKKDRVRMEKSLLRLLEDPRLGQE